jgi:hypothetical protein
MVPGIRECIQGSLTTISLVNTGQYLPRVYRFFSEHASSDEEP